jgi:microcystin-dependent protein
MTIEAPPLYLQGGAYPARLLRFLTAQMYDEGVLTPTACKVSQRGAGANFSVDVAIGSFVITGDDQALQGNYMGRITAVENAVIGAAPAGSNKRIDLVTLRINDPNAGGNAGNTATVVVVAGTQTTGTPVAPALPASSIPIAAVGPITSATASITNSIITDPRYIAGRKAPVGTMELIAGSTSSLNTPNGWLYCNGQAVSRTTYADLFVILGTSYGAGDGSTTFNIPDLRDRVPVAGGPTFSTAGATGGEVNHTLTSGESGLVAHSHTIDHDHPATDVVSPGSGRTLYEQFAAGGGTPIGVPDASNVANLVFNPYQVDLPNYTGSSGTVGGASASSPHNNMPPYQVLPGWMIRT